jgi:hypothetical protein
MATGFKSAGNLGPIRGGDLDPKLKKAINNDTVGKLNQPIKGQSFSNYNDQAQKATGTAVSNQTNDNTKATNAKSIDTGPTSKQLNAQHKQGTKDAVDNLNQPIKGQSFSNYNDQAQKAAGTAVSNQSNPNTKATNAKPIPGAGATTPGVGATADKAGNGAANKAAEAIVASTGVGKVLTKLPIPRKRRSQLIIIAAIVISLLFLAAWLISIPLKFLQFVHVLEKPNFGPGEHTTDKMGKKMAQRVFRARYGKDATGGNRSATGSWLRDKIHNLPIDKFNGLLAKDGVTMEFDNRGRFVGLLKNGQRFGNDLKDKSFWERRAAVGDIVSERIGGDGLIGHLKTALYTLPCRCVIQILGQRQSRRSQRTPVFQGQAGHSRRSSSR